MDTSTALVRGHYRRRQKYAVRNRTFGWSSVLQQLLFGHLQTRHSFPNSLCAKTIETTTSSLITVVGEEVQDDRSYGEQWFAEAGKPGRENRGELELNQAKVPIAVAPIVANPCDP